MGDLSGEWVLLGPHIHSSYSSHCGSFCIYWIVEGLLCWSSGCSQRHVLYAIVVLMCPWEDVSLGSFYSTILIWIPKLMVSFVICQLCIEIFFLIFKKSYTYVTEIWICYSCSKILINIFCKTKPFRIWHFQYYSWLSIQKH